VINELVFGESQCAQHWSYGAMWGTIAVRVSIRLLVHHCLHLSPLGQEI